MVIEETWVFFSSLKKLIFTFNHVKDIYDSFENPLK